MSATTLRRSPFGGVLGRGQLALIGLLLLLAAIAWLATGDRMAGMDAGPGTDLGTVGFYVSVWVVMMAAMMFPSIAPMVIMYNRVQVRRRELGRAAGPAATVAFVAGYLVTWMFYGVLAYGVFELFESLSVDALAWDRAGRYVAAGVVIAAAAYQFTPAKDVCLRHCRSPFDFVLRHWRPGTFGALRMGMEHGAWCVGCCWGLMAALFALGVMSIGWMVLVAAMIAVEKLLPWKALANRGVAVLLLALGLGIALAPGQVPGLTIPHSSAAKSSMSSMSR